MSTMYTVGLVIMVFTFFIDRRAMRVELPKVSSFIAIMFLVSLIRLSLMDFQLHLIPDVDISAPGFAGNFPLWRLIMVFTEDAFFSIPVYLIGVYFPKKRLIKYLVAAILSLFFVTLHLYQGIVVASIIGLYPFFVSYHFSKKYGFGTIMICHILYDFFTVLLAILAPVIFNNYYL